MIKINFKTVVAMFLSLVVCTLYAQEKQKIGSAKRMIMIEGESYYYYVESSCFDSDKTPEEREKICINDILGQLKGQFVNNSVAQGVSIDKVNFNFDISNSSISRVIESDKYGIRALFYIKRGMVIVSEKSGEFTISLKDTEKLSNTPQVVVDSISYSEPVEDPQPAAESIEIEIETDSVDNVAPEDIQSVEEVIETKVDPDRVESISPIVSIDPIFNMIISLENYDEISRYLKQYRYSSEISYIYGTNRTFEDNRDIYILIFDSDNKLYDFLDKRSDNKRKSLLHNRDVTHVDQSNKLIWIYFN